MAKKKPKITEEPTLQNLAARIEALEAQVAADAQNVVSLSQETSKENPLQLSPWAISKLKEILDRHFGGEPKSDVAEPTA